MIESIKISNTATFGSTGIELTGLSHFNYLFGTNGTGKTTISRIIADQACYPECSVKWKNGRPLETVVLNSDFVDNNFDQLKGVFTLGEEQKDTGEKIAEAQKELENERAKLAGLKAKLEGQENTEGKKEELAKLEREFQEKCWSQKKKHDEKLHGAFTGYRNNAQKFKEKVLDEFQTNAAPLRPIGDLEKRAETVFGETPSKEASIPKLDSNPLLTHESNPVLKKRIIGKDDVDIAAMIRRLGNSDWVRQGRKYYEENEKVCPFCQQETSDAFSASLAEYFDEAFETDSKAIDTLLVEYSTDSSDVRSQIEKMLDSPGKFLEVEKFKSQKAVLDQIINANQLLLDQKKKEPSREVELKSLATVFTSINKLIDDANAMISEHNKTVDNLAAEKLNLANEVWSFVLKELEQDLKQYREKKDALDKAISGINKNIEETNSRIRNKQKEIRDLEKQTTSIQPTIDGINAILSCFGFDSFKLAMGADKKSYRLIRHNGEDARQTLSEGEKAFVVFLYFYYLLRGSVSETGVTTDRIVVFDDPVSSLDCDILFIVSSLIREVCEEVRQGRGHIKQVFVLTHNIYFHREVTYNSRRKNCRLKEESFWIVRKIGSLSEIEQHYDNPVKTFYELLWMEVRKPGFDNLKLTPKRAKRSRKIDPPGAGLW